MDNSSGAANVRHMAYLDGLRGLLSLYVLCHHFLAWNQVGLSASSVWTISVFQSGHVAVCCFIVLSGYSLMLPVVNSADKSIAGGLGGYIKRRARRILPPYLGALVLSVAALAAASLMGGSSQTRELIDQVSAKAIVSHLFLVHTLVPGQELTLNGPLWSVATEWHIYFFFPLVLLPVWRRSGHLGLVLVSFSLGLIPLVVTPKGGHLWDVCPWFLGLFAIGMTAASTSGPAGSSSYKDLHRSIVVFGLSVILYIYLKTLKYGPDEAGLDNVHWMKDTAAGGMFWALLVACADHRGDGSGAGRGPIHLVLGILNSRSAIVLGKFSYSLYATHDIILLGMRFATDRLGLGPDSALLFRTCIGLPLALVVGHEFARWFEAPFLSKGPGSSKPSPPMALKPLGLN